MKKPFRQVKALAALATLVLLTSGCLRSELGIIVKDDGSADVKMRIAISIDALVAMPFYETISDAEAAKMWGDDTLYCRVTIPDYGAIESSCDPTPCDDPYAVPTTSSPDVETKCIPPRASTSPSSPSATPAPPDKSAKCAKFRKYESEDLTIPEGFVVTEVLDDKWCGWEITGTAKNTQELSLVASLLSLSDEDDTSPPTPDDFLITKDAAGGWSLISKNPLDCPEEEGLETTGMEAAMGLMMSNARIVYNIQLPGVPGANNATSVSGNTFTWEFSGANITAFCKLPDHDLRASTTPAASGAGNLTLKMLFGFGASLAAVAGGLVLKRRRGPGYPDGANHSSVNHLQTLPVWDTTANTWTSTDQEGVSYLYDQQTSQWIPRAPHGPTS